MLNELMIGVGIVENINEIRRRRRRVVLDLY